MDNITHSLTGALTAKFIESRPTAPEEKAGLRRTFFWLFVITANLPDIDVVFGLMTDPVTSIRHHRAITHSVLFAPVLALLPALLFYFFSKVKNIKLLWLVSLLGIFLHIFFDLLTSFGTRIMLPISETRYSLDWFFIIDPFFTLMITAFLLAGKWIPARRSLIMTLGIVAMVTYVLVAAFNHSMASIRIAEAARKEGVSWTRISALPQPLSLFRWQGLVQTEDTVYQTFFSLFDDSSPKFRTFAQSDDPLVAMAAQEPNVQWYLSFARHPWVQTIQEDAGSVVEFRDLMFSIDEELIMSFGFTERFIPFTLRYTYSTEGELMRVEFDGEEVAK
jgi:inner membrane protein